MRSYLLLADVYMCVLAKNIGRIINFVCHSTYSCLLSSTHFWCGNCILTNQHEGIIWEASTVDNAVRPLVYNVVPITYSFNVWIFITLYTATYKEHNFCPDQFILNGVWGLLHMIIYMCDMWRRLKQAVTIKKFTTFTILVIC